jgi:predicted nicotinamide N-methyase
LARAAIELRARENEVAVSALAGDAIGSDRGRDGVLAGDGA